MNIAIIGSGSWGVALAIHLAKNNNKVKIWSFAEDEEKLINNERKCKFLPNVIIPEEISCSLDYKEVIDGADLILHVTPSKFVRSIIKAYEQYVTENQYIIMCSKGLEPETMTTLDEIIKEELPNNKFGILSGPSHAEEVSRGVPTAMVIASEDDDVKNKVIEAFANEKMRMYKSSDVKGVELGGAFKNIIAFCSGIAAGLELGDNSYAALLSRGLHEITKLGIAMGGKIETFYGLTGLGDLIVTCGSLHSRNRNAGYLIGKGKQIDEVRKEIGMTIESIDNIEAAYALCKKHNVEMPIVDCVYDVLYNGLDINDAVTRLMTRKIKDE